MRRTRKSRMNAEEFAVPRSAALSHIAQSSVTPLDIFSVQCAALQTVRLTHRQYDHNKNRLQQTDLRLSVERLIKLGTFV